MIFSLVLLLLTIRTDKICIQSRNVVTLLKEQLFVVPQQRFLVKDLKESEMKNHV